MSDPVQLAIVAALTATAATLIKRIFDRLDAMNAKVDDLHASVNGKMDKFMKVSGDAREARGKLEGVAEEKARSRDEAPTL